MQNKKLNKKYPPHTHTHTVCVNFYVSVVIPIYISDAKGPMKHFSGLISMAHDENWALQLEHIVTIYRDE